MQAILLDAQQTSVLNQSHESIAVRDQAGTLLGHIVPSGAAYGQGHVVPGRPSNSQLEKDRWTECLNEWHADTAAEEREPRETA